MSKCFACVFHPAAPPDLVAMFEPYLHTHEKIGLKFFLSESVNDGTFFVRFEVLKSKREKPWSVAISPQHILAIVEVGKGSPMGFAGDELLAS